MPKKSKLENRPVQINANGRPIAYIGRFPPFRWVRWLKKIILGKDRL